MKYELLSVAVLFTFACDKRLNPAICCVTDAQCAALGLDEQHPCTKPGQTCKDNTCVGFECISNENCPSENPICVANVCEAACASDTDCADFEDRPYCATASGQCVSCVGDIHCSASAPICDSDAHECRGCEVDSECTGACIDASGTCVTDGEMVFVSATGQDAGDCNKTSPCATLLFAQGLTSQSRPVIKLLGNLITAGTSVFPLSATLDGSNTTLTGSTRPIIRVATNATIGGVRFPGAGFSDTMVTVAAGGNLKIANTTFDSGELYVDQGAVVASRVTMINGRMDCLKGSIEVNNSRFERSSAEPEDCALTLRRNRFSGIGDSGTMVRGNGLLTIENNLFVQGGSATAIALFGYDLGSTVRFNTIVSTAATHANAAILCLNGMNLTSNIIATNSTNPIVECTAQFTLFDAAGVAAVNSGYMNKSAESTLFFDDSLNNDFRPSDGSPALGMGEPGLVTSDIDGNPRPSPSGSVPDVGAFERP